MKAMACSSALGLLAIAALGCGRPGDSARRPESTGVLAQAASAPPVGATSQPSPPVERGIAASLRAAFYAKSPILDSIRVVETRSVGDRAGAVIVAYAVRSNHRYYAGTVGEMFGVFHALPGPDSTVRFLAFIESPAWLDYAVRIERIDADSIVLLGQTSYTENTHVVRWQVADAEPYVRPEDSWIDVTARFTDTLAMSFYDQPGGKRVPLDLHYQGVLHYGLRVLEVRDNWFRVAVWSPWYPGCDEAPTKPVLEDTLWTPLADEKGKRLLERYAPMC